MIYAMRHGQDDERFIGGWSDVSLISKGKKDTVISGMWLLNNVKVSNIISSDVKRARETAEIVSSMVHAPISYDANLREQSKGLLNGMNVDLARDNYPEFFQNVNIDTIYPEGESLRILFERIKSYLSTIESFQDNSLIITHRGVINMIYYLYNQKELDMNKKQFNVTPSSIHEIDVSNKLIRRVW